MIRVDVRKMKCSAVAFSSLPSKRAKERRYLGVGGICGCGARLGQRVQAGIWKLMAYLNYLKNNK